MSSLDASQTNVETSNAAEREVHVLGELVYGYTLLVTRVVEYGASANTLLSARRRQHPRGHGSISISRDLLSVRS